jgi:hypothetical protein
VFSLTTRAPDQYRRLYAANHLRVELRPTQANSFLVNASNTTLASVQPLQPEILITPRCTWPSRLCQLRPLEKPSDLPPDLPTGVEAVLGKDFLEEFEVLGRVLPTGSVEVLLFPRRPSAGP